MALAPAHAVPIAKARTTTFLGMIRIKPVVYIAIALIGRLLTIKIKAMLEVSLVVRIQRTEVTEIADGRTCRQES